MLSRIRFRRLVFHSLLALALGTSQAVSAQSPRPFTVDDFVKLRLVTSTALSPDGSQVLYTIEEMDLESNVNRWSLWLASAKGGRSIGLAAEIKGPGVGSPAWSPSGRQIAYLGAREGGQQIWLTEPVGGTPARLGTGRGDVQAFAWSPDGNSIAFIKAEPPAPAHTATPGIRVVGEGPAPPAPQIYLIELGTKAVRQVTKAAAGTDSLSWSPDGKEIAFSSQGDLYAVLTASRETKTLVARPGLDINPRWSPDGSRIAFFSGHGKPTGMRGLSVVPAVGGTPQDIQKVDPGFGGYPPRFLDWSADSRALYVSVLARMRQTLYAVSVATGEATPLMPADSSVYHDFSLSGDRRTLSYLMTGPATPSEVFVSPIPGWKPTQVTADTNPHLRGVRLGTPEAVLWKSKDGLEVEGLLLKPYGYAPGRRYPLLVQMEGTFGTYDFSFTGRVSADSPGVLFPFQQQVWAGAGYAVLMPNPRGSWGYGEEFRQSGRTDYGTGPYHDIMAGVDHVIGLGVAEPSQLGIMGIFFDGYRAAFAITQTDRFKAASVGAPSGFNLVSWYGQAGAGYVERYFGGPPWQAPQKYADISPVNFAGNIKTPTLIFSSEEPVAWANMQSQELHNALQRNNVPAEYVIYEKDGIFNRPKLLADIVSRNLKWFDRWLKRAPGQ
jgi:dipeptidyl aminopeptidase/acylaminoacyl peptidase